MTKTTLRKRRANAYGIGAGAPLEVLHLDGADVVASLYAGPAHSVDRGRLIGHGFPSGPQLVDASSFVGIKSWLFFANDAGLYEVWDTAASQVYTKAPTLATSGDPPRAIYDAATDRIYWLEWQANGSTDYRWRLLRAAPDWTLEELIDTLIVPSSEWWPGATTAELFNAPPYWAWLTDTHYCAQILIEFDDSQTKRHWRFVAIPRDGSGGSDTNVTSAKIIDDSVDGGLGQFIRGGTPGGGVGLAYISRGRYADPETGLRTLDSAGIFGAALWPADLAQPLPSPVNGGSEEFDTPIALHVRPGGTVVLLVRHDIPPEPVTYAWHALVGTGAGHGARIVMEPHPDINPASGSHMVGIG